MVILGSVSSWLRGQLKRPEKNENIAHLNARRSYFRALFRFPRFLLRPDRPGRSTSPVQAHVPWSGAVLLHHKTRSPRDHARFFQNRTEDIEIDPKSIYVDISGPHPDLPPSRLVKTHQKSRKSQCFRYFSKLVCLGSSRNATERSTTCKTFIFFWSLQFAIQLRVSGDESTPAGESKCIKFSKYATKKCYDV